MNLRANQTDILIEATSICIKLQTAGYGSYLVGGCVRDLILFPLETPKDIDICTSASPEVIESTFGKSPFVGKSFGVCLVRSGQFVFEVASFRTEGSYSDRRHPDTVALGTLEQDAGRRDFTMNALYLDPVSKKMLDFYGGQADLNQKIIRCVGDAQSRLYEDPLRILRLFRFASRFEFGIDAETLDAAKLEQSGIGLLSRDRILSELAKVPAHKLWFFYLQFFKEIDSNWLFLELQSDLSLQEFIKKSTNAKTKELVNFLEDFFTCFPKLVSDLPFYCLILFVSRTWRHTDFGRLKPLLKGYNLTTRETKWFEQLLRFENFDKDCNQSLTTVLVNRVDQIMALMNLLDLMDSSFDFLEWQAKVFPNLEMFQCDEWKVVLNVLRENKKDELSLLPSKNDLRELILKRKLHLKYIGRIHRLLEMAPFLLAIDKNQGTALFANLESSKPGSEDFYVEIAGQWLERQKSNS